MRQELLNEQDLAFLESRGISKVEATQQIQLLEHGVDAPVLLRAATVGDGIVRCPVEELDALLPAFDLVASDGGVGFFVPASGAASRMFAGPAQLLAGTHPDPQGEAKKLRRLAQAPVVQRNLWEKSVDPDDAQGIATLLIKEPPEGYGWAARPKAFVPFHEDPEPSFPLRTPLEEQIAESSEILGKSCRGVVHFTLADGWPLPAHFDDACRTLGRRHGGEVVAVSSLQSPSTDTLSLEADGTLVRDKDGRPALRAGGHGSLLGNLALTPGRVVLVKNIDNIQPDARRPYVVPWRRRLGALALALKSRSEQFLATGDSQGLRALAKTMGIKLPESDAALREQVDRPLRVAGMVPNVGEPGGGPFWVASEQGERLEIVEQSEIDASQKGLISGSTHFNPVELACCLDRADGTRYDLDAFVDPSRAFLSKKPSPRGELRVFERPGLWNGAMSGWWTVFLEIPLDTFLPAKTIHDLAHPWRLETERA